MSIEISEVMNENPEVAADLDQLRWLVFRGMKGDTGEKGDPGFSPEITSSAIPGGHRIDITNELGPDSFNVMDGEDGADGTDGVSPTVTITEITRGHRVKITDAEHPNGQSFDVMNGFNGTNGTNGVDGHSPYIDPTTNTWWYFDDASGLWADSHLDPDGETGPQGPAGTPGTDGVSPTVTVTEIEGGHRVTITDATGAHPFDVMDGEDGEGGGSSNAVLYTQQSLTDAQKAQARTNVGAGTYSKPSGGIPASDLASAVQTSLGKADSAYQKPGGGIPASDLASGVIPTVPTAEISANTAARHTHSNKTLLDTYTQTEANLADAVSKKHSHSNKTVLDGITAAKVQSWDGKGTYSKPSGGIPKSDLASAVQTSLDKADTALQQHQSLAGYATETYVQQQIAAIPAELPAVTASDNGNFLRVVNGAWAAATVPAAESNSFGGGS